MTRPGLGSALVGRLFPEQASGAHDPVEWIEQTLGERLWSKQVEVARSVLAHRYTAVKAAHAVGKSWLAARLAAWWIASRPVGESFVVSTAPTTPQVRAILWRELGRAHRRGALPGRITTGSVPEWWIGSELVAWGRKPADLSDREAAAAAFSGVHSPRTLVILDESAGIDGWLFDAADTLATNEAARVIALGNPLDPTSRFAEVCKPGSGWNTIKISAFDAPAFSGEKVPPEIAEVLVSQRWVEERRQRWGTESPLYVARVAAEFPEAAEDSLVSPADVEAARRRELPGNAVPRFACDVARSGEDETVIYEDRDGVVRLRHRAQGADTMATTGQVARLLRETERSSAVIDVIGVGAGVFDRLREQGLDVAAFNSAERAQRPDRFANRRAEAYWSVRDALREGRLDLDPADDDLAAQLLAIRWTVNSRGQVVIESKDEMRKRGVSSPDRADALAMVIGGSRSGPIAVSISAGEVEGGVVDDWRWRRFLDEGKPPGQTSFTGDLMDRPL